MSWVDYVPGLANIHSALQGNWSDAVDPFQAGENAYHGIKSAYDAPFDQKRAGYDAVIAQAGNLKNERMARKDRTYEMAEDKLRPAREALAAVYGDPSKWSL